MRKKHLKDTETTIDIKHRGKHSRYQISRFPFEKEKKIKREKITPPWLLSIVPCVGASLIVAFVTNNTDALLSLLAFGIIMGCNIALVIAIVQGRGK